jgi:CheY-like chemotaxis protein/anti-sigma regulatory factor (Ser/Thr protein kinase)
VRIAQALGNLLGNAVKFTPRGGRVTVELRQEGDRARLRVADTGIGIEPEQVARVFEPFMQADRSLDRSRGGLGLGLALVKAVVDLHDGEVKASSDGPGRGACFTIDLPAQEPPGPAEARAETPPAPASRHRVLVIEDNRDSAESLRDALELMGHEAAVAFDGQEALAAAHDFRPQVVLCDIGLPGLDGYEVARRFRADPELKSALLVAVTGYAQPEDQRQAEAAGFRHHLAKPPSLDALARLLGH